MIWLFAAALFVSASLLFYVQPMIGKMLLPILGGAPAVWNACMVFFQAMLLLGYAYAHYSIRWLGVRRQAVMHVALLWLPLLVLPIVVNGRAMATAPAGDNPVPWLLAFLVVAAGLPFFMVSASAPLLQRWFSATGHRHAGDPYFLYATSNAGSLLGLLSYPLLAERHLRLMQQSRLWEVGYISMALLVGTCAIALWRSSPGKPLEESTVRNVVQPTWTQKLRWMLLAFVPSSLMLGVTTYLTSDVAPFPLLWILPLAIYLGTFILVFARRPVLAPSPVGRGMCLIAVVLLIAFIVQATHPAWLMMALHLLMFAAAAWVCHGELAKSRPAPERLTDFYLCMSIGGVLGGAFNTLVAPLLFRTLVEYPLVMLAACAVRPTGQTSQMVRGRDLAWAASIGLLTVGLILAVQRFGVDPGRASTLWIFALPALLAYRFVARPVRFALCLGAILLASTLYVDALGSTQLVTRNFFGVLRVTVDATGKFRQLVHGNTLHGRQSLDPARQDAPLAYYHRTGPAGQVFEVFNASASPRTVGVIGLGAGAMASYAKPGQQWTFYEINPAVERIARQSEYFTFLKRCRTESLTVVLGDARLRLKDSPPGHYDLIVLDAFSSDSIPMHLVTREALRLYLEKLTENGLLAFHITNRRLDLRPVLANLAHDAKLACLGRDDNELSETDWLGGKEASRWVVMARRPQDLAALAADRRWQPLPEDARVGVWSDDFSNILAVLIWRR